MVFEFHLKGHKEERSSPVEAKNLQIGISRDDSDYVTAQRNALHHANIHHFGFNSTEQLLAGLHQQPTVQFEYGAHQPNFSNPYPGYYHGGFDPNHRANFHPNHRAGVFPQPEFVAVNRSHHDVPIGNWRTPEIATGYPTEPRLTIPYAPVNSYTAPNPYTNPYVSTNPYEPLPLNPSGTGSDLPYAGGSRNPLEGGPIIPGEQPQTQPQVAATADNQNHPFCTTDVARTAANYGVNQAGHGDCWFESSLAGLAHSPTGPENISKMITKTANGYMVTFPGDPTHPVMVSEADIKADKLNDKAKWAQVVEAALIKHNPHEAAHGGDPQMAIALLTGEKTTDQNSKDVSGSDLARKLAEGPVVASTPKKDSQVAGRTDRASSTDATVPNHAYTVVGYDPKTGTVTVRNPWGHNNGTAVGKVGETHDGVTNRGNGVLTMSYDTFQKQFSTVSSKDDSATAQASTWAAKQWNKYFS